MQSTQNLVFEQKIAEKFERLGRIREAAECIIRRHKQDGKLNFRSEEERKNVRAHIEGLFSQTRQVNQEVVDMKNSPQLKDPGEDDEGQESCNPATRGNSEGKYFESDEKFHEQLHQEPQG